MLETITVLLDKGLQAEFTEQLHSLSLLNFAHHDSVADDSPPCVASLQAWRPYSDSVSAVLRRLCSIVSSCVRLAGQGAYHQHTFAEMIGSCSCAVIDAVNDDDGGSAAASRGLVCVALTLLHLLAPVGPMDPVQKSTVKLQHFKKEVGGGWLLVQSGLPVKVVDMVF